MVIARSSVDRYSMARVKCVRLYSFLFHIDKQHAIRASFKIALISWSTLLGNSEKYTHNTEPAIAEAKDLV